MKNGKTKGNLGCGTDYRKGWLNVDIREEVDPDMAYDLDELPWPWATDSFEYILMDNVIEHLENQAGVLIECHRILDPNGILELRFPHWNSPGAYTDPTHISTITENTLDHPILNDDWAVENIEYATVRFGRALPDPVAAFLADHVGHLVSEVTLMAHPT